jgi:hypothetical protein
MDPTQAPSKHSQNSVLWPLSSRASASLTIGPCDLRSPFGGLDWLLADASSDYVGAKRAGGAATTPNTIRMFPTFSESVFV